MADTPAAVRRDYRGTEGVIDDADPAPAEAPAPATTVRSSAAVTVEQVKETERTPKADEGVRAFGPPLTTGASETERQKRNQSTDDKQ